MGQGERFVRAFESSAEHLQAEFSANFPVRLRHQTLACVQPTSLPGHEGTEDGTLPQLPICSCSFASKGRNFMVAPFFGSPIHWGNKAPFLNL